MANKSIDMTQIKQIIRLHSEGKSLRQITQMLGLSRKTVTKYMVLSTSLGLTYETVRQMNEQQIYDYFEEKQKPSSDRLEKLQNLFPYIENELKRIGVTKLTLWTEYKIKHPNGYNYTQFCHYYNQWIKSNEVTMHFEHKAGDKMFVDFTGKKLYITDRHTGERQELEVFVAILGASQLTYVEAVGSQKIEDFIGAVENAMHAPRFCSQGKRVYNMGRSWRKPWEVLEDAGLFVSMRFVWSTLRTHAAHV